MPLEQKRKLQWNANRHEILAKRAREIEIAQGSGKKCSE